jgi:hypothetical protein
LKEAKIAQLVEHDLAKVGVASSSLVFRSVLKETLQKVRLKLANSLQPGWRNW